MLSVSLRPATMDDAGTILAWQQDSEIRQYFRNPQPVTESEHLEWMKAQLAETEGMLAIIEASGNPAGTLRLRSIAPDSYEVSILLSADYRRQGVGKAALGLAEKQNPGAHFVAEVLPGNDASRALFVAAGFVPSQDRDGFYILDC